MTRHKLFILMIALIFGISLTLSCATVQELFAEPTATSTLIPTTTRTPTITPTITPTPEPDLSEAVLTLDDLPPGYIVLPLDELGISMDDLGGDDFDFESAFAFLETTNFEIVMGFTTLLLNALEQAGFDFVLNYPEILLESMATGMGATGISKREELVGLDDIGDNSVGLRMVVDMEGIPMRMDMVAFRRDVAGAVVLVFYVEGSLPVTSVGDVARKLDARIVEILQPAN